MCRHIKSTHRLVSNRVGKSKFTHMKAKYLNVVIKRPLMNFPGF